MRTHSISLALTLALAAGCPGGDGGTETMGTTTTGMTGTTMTGGMTTGAETGAPTTGGMAAGGYCAKGCAMPADCCPMGVPDCPGAYPNNWTCDAGVCGAPQCSADDQCTFGGAFPDNKCLTVDSLKVCLDPCTADTDCTAPSTCIGVDDGGTKYCTVESDGEGCMSDADCMGYGKCDTMTGACQCTVDADCTGIGVDKCVM